MAARLTERPGSSATWRAGSSRTRTRRRPELLGVDPALIERHGAVSPEVALAMADGALARFDADTAIAITGVAGPDGGTEAKPVGYVCWCAKLADGAVLARDVRAARRPRRGPRPLDHRRHAPAAAAAAWRGAPVLSGRARAARSCALDLPDRRPRTATGRRGATRCVAGRDDLRPVAPESLHVTLVFLGYRPEKDPGDRRGRLRGHRRGCARHASSARRSAPCRRARRACSRSTWSTRTAAPPRSRRRSRRARGGRFYTAREAPVLAAHHARAREARASARAPLAGSLPRRPARLRGARAHALPLDPAPAGRALRAARPDGAVIHRAQRGLVAVACLVAAGCGGGADQDEPATREQARACLERAGLHVTGGEPAGGRLGRAGRRADRQRRAREERPDGLRRLLRRRGASEGGSSPCCDATRSASTGTSSAMDR